VGVVETGVSDREVAAENFYRAHRARAVGWAVVLTGRSDVGEELAQDALLRTIDQLDGLHNPTAYLRVAVVNACRSWHRASSREDRRVVKSHRDKGVGEAPWLSGSSLEMLDLLSGLPYKHRAALLLRFWGGWTDSEIAEALACRPASVRVYVHRGLGALREVLARSEEVD
jgi:RNA polymerase sigma factor (sigma-70 family)